MKKVVLGMSGGVDSAVSAYLLKEQGYEVICLFMQNWDPALNGDLADPYVDKEICQAQEDYNDAKQVAKQLGLPIYKVDFVSEYWNKVFQFFLSEYKKGRTPNPDILCNKYIKFKAFMDYAFEEFNPDYIAMGHYARVEHEPVVRLLRGLDDHKDQTYFLEQLSKEQLSKSLFPIGNLEKSEVRRIAKENNFVNAEKKDSTGICFIGERNFTKFLEGYIPKNPGDVIDIESNEVVGTHNGLMFHTIGQRKGLGIGGLKGRENAKFYVCQKDIEKNILYVTTAKHKEFLTSNKVIISDINIIREENILSVKFRYNSEDVKVISVTKEKDKYILTYNPTEAVTPGQACVFYNNEECLGGGTIDEVYYNDVRVG